MGLNIVIITGGIGEYIYFFLRNLNNRATNERANDLRLNLIKQIKGIILGSRVTQLRSIKSHSHSTVENFSWNQVTLVTLHY